MRSIPAPKGWNHYTAYNAEYRAAVRSLELPLPDGVTLPPNAPDEETDARDVLWQVGAGDVAALFAWLREAERAAVDAHRAGDIEEAHRWIMICARFVETDTFERFNDHSAPVSWYDAVIRPALAGDLSAMAAEIETRG